jgi:D-arginine dehydrogenase
VDVDVAVIGGGIAGAAAAWAIAPHASVAVLEAESAVGFHSTGRSAAILTESYESGLIRALTARTRRILGEEFGELTGVLSDRGVLWVAARGEQAALEAAAETARRGPAEVRRIDAGEARRLCPALRAGACAGALFEPEAKAIDVDLLHQEMLRRARADGCAVLLDARVDALERQPAGWVIRFGGSELRACALVNAAGPWADHIAALAGVAPAGLSPLRRTVFLFDPPPGSGHQSWPFTIGIAEAWYFGPHGPVMLGSNGDEHPDVPRDVRAEDIDVAEAIEKINAATTLGIRSVLTQWAGLRTFAADRLPVIGPDPDDPAFHWYAGLGGFGIMTCAALGRAVATAVLGRPRDQQTDEILRAAAAKRTIPQEGAG